MRNGIWFLLFVASALLAQDRSRMIVSVEHLIYIDQTVNPDFFELEFRKQFAFRLVDSLGESYQLMQDGDSPWLFEKGQDTSSFQLRFLLQDPKSATAQDSLDWWGELYRKNQPIMVKSFRTSHLEADVMQGFLRVASEIKRLDRENGRGRWVQQGSRSVSSIMSFVKVLTPQLKNIYNQYLEQRPGFSGKVVLKFTIAADGSVIAISQVSSSTQYTDFDAAILAQVAKWQFRAIPNGNVTVTLPFSFSE